MEKAKEILREVIEAAVDARLAQILGGLLAEVRRPGASLPGAGEAPPAAAPQPLSLGKRRKRLRHPETNALITREERDAYLAEQEKP